MLINQAAQANTAPADFANAIVEIVMPIGASGTDATTFASRDGQFARLELSIDTGVRKVSYAVPATIQLRQGRA